MKKRNILKENREFSRIIGKYKPIKNFTYILYKEEIEEKGYYFGISVSKKVGNAVIRNKIKRQIKNILDKNTYEKNFKCIIIIKKQIIDKSFIDREKDLIHILNKAELIKGEKDEK